MIKTIIIIVTYNGMKWLKKSLKSTEPYPVIVVDNCSTDGTTDYIKEYFPEVTLLTQKKNLGFGKANNKGISLALNRDADFVFLLNQDAYLKEDTIERLVEVQRRNKIFGIISPIHLNGTGNKLDRNFSNYLGYDRNHYFYSDYILGNQKKTIYEVPFVNAAGWLISRACLEKVGGFDPVFFHYGEDENYCQRVVFHGFKAGVVPDVYIQHDRENRKQVHDQNLHDQLIREARYLKVKYADINHDLLSEVSGIIKGKRRARIKSIVKLDFSSIKYRSKEISLLEKIFKEITISRKINKNVGPNYL